MTDLIEWKFEIGQEVKIIGGGRLTPAKVIQREIYSDGTRNYRVEWDGFNGRMSGWILEDDLVSA